MVLTIEGIYSHYCKTSHLNILTGAPPNYMTHPLLALPTHNGAINSPRASKLSANILNPAFKPYNFHVVYGKEHESGGQFCYLGETG